MSKARTDHQDWVIRGGEQTENSAAAPLGVWRISGAGADG